MHSVTRRKRRDRRNSPRDELLRSLRFLCVILIFFQTAPEDPAWSAEGTLRAPGQRLMSTRSETMPSDRRTDSRPTGPGADARFRLFRWVGEHVRGFHAAVGALLFVGLAIIVVCVTLFGLLADEVMEGDT